MNLQDRIYILDGATGTALQQFRLTEADFRFPSKEIMMC